MSRSHILSRCQSSRRIAPLALRRPIFAMVGLATALALSVAGAEPVEARAARDGVQKQAAKQQGTKREAGQRSLRRPVHGSWYRPPYAAIVVDANSGQVLHEIEADEPRHPASLAKIMTLYVLFEQLAAGQIKLGTPLTVSSRAALTAPVRLGLKTGQTITVEDALKALVTKSANDAATVIAESLAGSEEEFAKIMTRKARALGMSSTTYINASGLPAADQITTARDQAILARAVQDRFPDYYRYFSIPSFMFRGREIRTHVSLLGQLQGVDGIKTGYTQASGYNLTSSLRRDERHIVAVVLGGTSNAARDTRMRQLLEEHLPKGTTRRNVIDIVEAADQGEPTPLPDHFRPPNGVKPEPPPAVAGADGAEGATPLPLPKPASIASKPRQGEAKRSAGGHHRARRSAVEQTTITGRQAATFPTYRD